MRLMRAHRTPHFSCQVLLPYFAVAFPIPPHPIHSLCHLTQSPIIDLAFSPASCQPAVHALRSTSVCSRDMRHWTASHRVGSPYLQLLLPACATVILTRAWLSLLRGTRETSGFEVRTPVLLSYWIFVSSLFLPPFSLSFPGT